MPFIEKSSYTTPPRFQFNGHLQTIVASFRKIDGVTYKRERIFTPDDDFLDLDWIDNNSRKLVILTHGLEGNSSRPYIKGMAKMFSKNGYDILAWNCRSCSGEMNKQFRLYNHGDIGDIDLVVETALKRKNYDGITLIGFSMGGNISLKYAAVKCPPSVKKVIAFSAPLDMESSNMILDIPSNWLYKNRFESKLMPKIKEKARLYPDKINITEIKKRTDWVSQLETFFCTLNGYPSLENFHENGSALRFIPQLRIPSLIVQAQNDPISTPKCIPIELARTHEYIHLEAPKYGGHCGFMLRGDKEHSWAEHRALEFEIKTL
jgi:uncharacterized protein